MLTLHRPERHIEFSITIHTQPNIDVLSVEEGALLGPNRLNRTYITCMGMMIIPGIIVTALHCLYENNNGSLNELLAGMSEDLVTYTITIDRPVGVPGDWKFIRNNTPLDRKLFIDATGTGRDTGILYNKAMFETHYNNTGGNITIPLLPNNASVIRELEDGKANILYYTADSILQKAPGNSMQIHMANNTAIWRDSNLHIIDGMSGNPILYTPDNRTYYFIGNLSSGDDRLMTIALSFSRPSGVTPGVTTHPCYFVYDFIMSKINELKQVEHDTKSAHALQRILDAEDRKKRQAISAQMDTDEELARSLAGQYGGKTIKDTLHFNQLISKQLHIKNKNNYLLL